MLIIAFVLAKLLASQPEPVVVLRSTAQPLRYLAPGLPWQPLGSASATGYGLGSGRVRFLVSSESLGVAVVAVVARDGGALFVVKPGAEPRRLTATRSVEIDVALSPDGTRLLYVDEGQPCVVSLVDGARVVMRVPPVTANLPEVRITWPRWLDNETVYWEREVMSRHSSVIKTHLEYAAAAEGRVRSLVPWSGKQDSLAALVGKRALVFRGGVLHVIDDGVATALDPDARVVAPFPNTDGRYAAAVIEVGKSEPGRAAAMFVFDAAGLRPLADKRKVYGDALVTPDRGHVWRSVLAPGGWRLERIALSDGKAAFITPTARDPILLARVTPDGVHVVGCRGREIVVATEGDTRVVGLSDPERGCHVRAVTNTHVAYDADGEHFTIASFDGQQKTYPGAVVGSLAGGFVVQTGWNGVAAIATAPGSKSPVMLVPWQYDDIQDVLRTPDGGTLVFRIGDAWHLVHLVQPAAVVALRARGRFVGLTDDRLVVEAGGLYSWSLRDLAAAPEVWLDVPFVGPLVAGHVTGMRADGVIMSAPVDDLDRRTVVMRPGHARGLVADRFGRVVTAAIIDGRSTIIAAKIDGSDVDRPVALGHPRAPMNCGLDYIAATARGDIAMHYVRLNMGSVPSCGGDVLAADGSGYLVVEPALPINTVPVDPNATESRTVVP